MLRLSNDVNHKQKCKDCNLKYLCGGGCIATTYKVEGNFLAYPQTMCEFLARGAKQTLENIIYSE